MRHPSRHALAQAAASAGIITLAAGFAPAAAAAPSAPPARQKVPCSTTALASAISGAASGDTLVLTAGCTYQVTGSLLKISTNLAIEGHGAALAVPDSAEDPGFTILSVAGVTLFIRNLNFTGGGGDYVCGGAISTGGNVTINGGTFQENGLASDSDGAICNRGQLTVRGVTFAYNYAEGYGGAIVNDGQLTVIASTFTGNHADYADGAIDNAGTLTATATSITGNTASLAGAAGGIDNEGSGAYAGITHLHRDTIRANTPVNCYHVPGCTG